MEEMEEMIKSTQTAPTWATLSLMLAGCVGLVVTLFAWLFGEGPLPTPWFMALFSLCSVMVAVATTHSVLGWMLWFTEIVAFDTVVYLQYIRTVK